MLLHTCSCNIWFTSTKPECKVLVNWILHEQGCNNEFISHWSYTIYTLRMLRSNMGVWTKIEDSNHVGEDLCNQPLKKIRLSLAFFEENAESFSLWRWRWWFCIKRGATALEDLSIKRHAEHCITSKGCTVLCINCSVLYPIYCTGDPFEV